MQSNIHTDDLFSHKVIAGNMYIYAYISLLVCNCIQKKNNTGNNFIILYYYKKKKKGFQLINLFNKRVTKQPRGQLA